MRVAIKAAPLTRGDKIRGVGVYTRSLVTALQALNDGNEYRLSDETDDGGFDVVHYPFFDPFFLTLPWRRKKPTVVTVHDVIPLVFADKYPPGIRGGLKYLIQKVVLSGVEAIITDSQCSKKDVYRYLKIPKDKIASIALAPNPDVVRQPEAKVGAVLNKYGIQTPYLLYVGDINFNKNVPGLIKAFSKLKDNHLLVMVSHAMANDIPEAKEIRGLINSLWLGERIKVLTQVPLEPATDLAALYSGADWYVQPSYYEGFGLPVLEAMRCQTPVISSCGGSLPEVVGSAAIYFDPKKDDLFLAIKRALAMDGERRARLIKDGDTQVGKYSWKRTALDTSSVYGRLV